MQSWIESANSADTEFPLQNLPFGVASIGETSPRCVTAIGDYVLDLAVCEQTGLLRLDAGGGDSVFAAPSINAFMALGAPAWARVREQFRLGHFIFYCFITWAVLSNHLPANERELSGQHPRMHSGMCLMRM